MKHGELQAEHVPKDEDGLGSSIRTLASRPLTIDPNCPPKLQTRLLSKVSEMKFPCYPMMFPLAMLQKLEEHFLLLWANQVLIIMEAIKKSSWVSIFQICKRFSLE